MIRTASVAALGLILNTCPFTPAEEPDGYARVTGQVLRSDGSPYPGRIHLLCWSPPDESPLFFREGDLDERGRYNLLLESPLGSRPMQAEPFEFLCRAQSGPRGAAFAVRYVTVPFARTRADAPTTRIDLREGEMEPPP
jgi:hypothetical protein